MGIRQLLRDAAYGSLVPPGLARNHRDLSAARAELQEVFAAIISVHAR
jgi:hypothetical protein